MKNETANTGTRTMTHNHCQKCGHISTGRRVRCVTCGRLHDGGCGGRHGLHYRVPNKNNPQQWTIIFQCFDCQKVIEAHQAGHITQVEKDACIHGNSVRIARERI